MAKIKPISFLRDTTAVSDCCHSLNEPLYITKNGTNDLVLMSDDVFDRLQASDSHLHAVHHKAERRSEHWSSSFPNHGFIRVSARQISTSIFDVTANLEGILAELDKATANQEKIVTFPELALTGYTAHDLFFQEALWPVLDTALAKLRERSRSFDGLFAVGCPLRIDEKLYNVAAVFSGGHILGFIPKTHLPNYREFYEKRQFNSGEDLDLTLKIGKDEVPCTSKLIFSASGYPALKIGIEICEDLWSPDPPSTALALGGATIILNLSASNDKIGKVKQRRQLVESTSDRLEAAYVYSSSGGGESTSDLVYGGAAMIAEEGRVIAENKLFSGEAIFADIDLERIVKERQQNTTFIPQKYIREMEFSVDLETAGFARHISPTPFIPDDEKELDLAFKLQVEGLKSRLRLLNAKAVLGLSGGLDSTLAALVTLQAMQELKRPSTEVYAFSLPAFGTGNRTRNNSSKLAKLLNFTFEEIDIGPALNLHFKDIAQDQDRHDTAYENAQARERTQILMDKANQLGGIVIGTGDLSESCLGWSTYNGDHMSNYSVNISVPKTLVKALVLRLADTVPALAEVLRDIAATPISPELLPADKNGGTQQTEDLIGPYRLHDFFIFYALRYGFSPRKIFFLATHAFASEFTPEAILRWEKLFYSRFVTQQFKRNCLPDGPKVGPISISPRGDLRMPSDASPQLFLSELETIDIKNIH